MAAQKGPAKFVDQGTSPATESYAVIGKVNGDGTVHGSFCVGTTWGGKQAVWVEPGDPVPQAPVDYFTAW